VVAKRLRATVASAVALVKRRVYIGAGGGCRTSRCVSEECGVICAWGGSRKGRSEGRVEDGEGIERGGEEERRRGGEERERERKGRYSG